MSKPNENLPEALPAPESESADVRLRLTDPWVHQFNVPTADGGTLVVTQRPLAFSSEDAETVKQAAEKHGLHLTEVSE